MHFDRYVSFEKWISKILRLIKWAKIILKTNFKQSNIWGLFTIDKILWCCNFGLKKKFMKKINKKYIEIMRQAADAVGRKEVVSLLKKAAVIMSKSEDKLAS